MYAIVINEEPNLQNCQYVTDEYLWGQTIETKAYTWQVECWGKISEKSAVKKFASNLFLKGTTGGLKNSATHY